MHLTGNGEDILLKVFEDAEVGIVVGQAVEQSEVSINNGNALFQNGEDAIFFDLAIEAFQNQPLPVGFIPQFIQFLRLGDCQKSPELGAIDGKFPIKISGVALFVTGTLHQCRFYAIFERSFIGLTDHAYLPPKFPLGVDYKQLSCFKLRSQIQ